MFVTVNCTAQNGPCVFNGHCPQHAHQRDKSEHSRQSVNQAQAQQLPVHPQHREHQSIYSLASPESPAAHGVRQADSMLGRQASAIMFHQHCFLLLHTACGRQIQRLAGRPARSCFISTVSSCCTRRAAGRFNAWQAGQRDHVSSALFPPAAHGVRQADSTLGTQASAIMFHWHCFLLPLPQGHSHLTQKNARGTR